jgi:predicted ABC-type ATPase
MNKGRLTPEEIKEIAADYVDAEMHRTAEQDRPVAKILAGQSGAGKSTLVDGLEDELRAKGGFITVSADVMRLRLPYLDELDTNAPDFAPQTAADAGALAIAVRHEAMARRRNVVVDGTLWSPDAAVALAKDLRASGYRTELHALAVNEQISYQRAATRYERERAAGGLARWTVRELHDRSYHGVADSVRRLEYTAAVDRVVIHNRLGDIIHDAAPTQGQTPGGDKLERARAQLTAFERMTLANNWDEIVESMERRGANEDERLLVQAAQERAHYTMRTAPEVAEQYDSQNRMEAPTSQAYAAAYGARLARAYKADRPASQMPELAAAYQAKQLALREQGPLSDRDAAKLSADLDRQLMDCLMQGRKPVCETASLVQRQLEALKKECADIVESFQLAEASGMPLTEHDRNDLREAQQKLAVFVEKHADQLTRSAPTPAGHALADHHRAESAPVARSSAPRPG